MSDKKQFIVPVKFLASVVVETTQDALNDDVNKIARAIAESEDIKKEMYQWSVKLSEQSAKVMPSSVVFVPNLVLSVKSQEDADIAIQFIKDYNENAMKAQKENAGTETEDK